MKWRGRNQTNSPPVEARFFEKVQKTKSCWLWKAATCRLGYGLFHSPVGKRAHRWSYFFHYGSLAEDKMVLHKCDVRNCVNPDHLYLGTQSDNMRDCRDRGRRFQPEIRGEKNPMAVLTEKKVKEMRMIRKKKHTSYNKIAKLFGVSTMTAYRAVSGKCWV